MKKLALLFILSCSFLNAQYLVEDNDISENTTEGGKLAISYDINNPLEFYRLKCENAVYAQFPGGENALQLIPSEVVCFDEIGPCSYVSRDFAFLIQNAIPNPYKIMFDYCIEEVAIVAANKGSAEFDITVVAS